MSEKCLPPIPRSASQGSKSKDAVLHDWPEDLQRQKQPGGHASLAKPEHQTRPDSHPVKRTSPSTIEPEKCDREPIGPSRSNSTYMYPYTGGADQSYDRGTKGSRIFRNMFSRNSTDDDSHHSQQPAKARRQSLKSEQSTTSPSMPSSFHPHNPPRSQPKVLRKEIERGRKDIGDEIKVLLDKIQTLERNCKHLQRRNDALQAFRDAREDLLGRQESDSTLSASFDAITLQTKTWAVKSCKDAKDDVDLKQIDPDLLPKIQRVMPGLQNIEDLPRLLPSCDIRSRRQFIRGWIALNLTESLFRSLPAPNYGTESGSDVWIPEKSRNAVKSLEMTFINSDSRGGEAIAASTFHEWRTLTFSLFCNLYPQEYWFRSQGLGDILDATTKNIMDVVLPLAPFGIGNTVLEEQLRENVLLPAIELSQTLRRQRACWYVRFPHLMIVEPAPPSEFMKPHLFQPSQMKDVDSLKEDESGNHGSESCLKVVKIVISSGLYKSGNHDGEQYDTEFPVAKAEVSCVEDRNRQT